MQLNIAAEHVINITDIMEEYILEEVKEKSGDFKAVNALCSFYRKLKEATSSVGDSDTDMVLVADEVVQKVFPDIIEKHIGDIVKDADNLDLISEITAIYNCMKNDIPMSSGSNTKNNGKQGSKYKKNGGGKSEDNRTSQMDVKDAQYAGENTQNTSEKSGQSTGNGSKQQVSAGVNTNAASYTGQAANTSNNAGGTTATDNSAVKNPQWAYDDDVLC